MAGKRRQSLGSESDSHLLLARKQGLPPYSFTGINSEEAFELGKGP